MEVSLECLDKIPLLHIKKKWFWTDLDILCALSVRIMLILQIFIIHVTNFALKNCHSYA